MAKHTPTSVDFEPEEELELSPRAELRSARSLVRKLVKDAYAADQAKRFGLVVDVAEDADGVRLLARFPGEEVERRIALRPVADGHYLDPEDVKARYRRLSERDIAELKSIAAAR